MTNDAIIAGEPSLLRRADIGLTTPWQEPRTETERKLAYIWQQVLGIDAIGASDDFFEIGGDSLAAAVLAVEIEATFGIQFQLADFINLSTVAKQALAVVRNTSSTTAQLPSWLIVGRAAGSQPPVFVVHGAWGFSFLKRDFIDEVGQDRPVYLFQAPGLDGRTRPLASVEEIASLYVASIREVQPRDPYYIVALCAGSFIALEMCNQLQEAGSNVARLILVDPSPTPKIAVSQYREDKRWGRIAKEAKSHLKQVKSDLKSFYKKTFYTKAEQRKRFRQKIQKITNNTDWIFADENSNVPEMILETSKQLRRALKRYMPHHAYAGSAAMLLISQKGPEILRDGSFWRSHLSGIEYQVCDWDHHDVFGVHLVETARFVRNALEMPLDSRLMPEALIGYLSTGLM